MMIYELINPSDKCTLEAESLSIAAFSALVLSPRYGVKNVEDEDDTFFAFFGAGEAFEEQWGPINDFLDKHATEIANCLDTFAYVSAEERVQYVRALELIDDPEKRAVFRSEHDDRRRSSVNQICLAAWDVARQLREAKSEAAAGKTAGTDAQQDE